MAHCNRPQSGNIVDGSRGLDGGASEQAVKHIYETVKRMCAAVEVWMVVPVSRL